MNTCFHDSNMLFLIYVEGLIREVESRFAFFLITAEL